MTNVQTQNRRPAVPDPLTSLVGRMAAEYGVDEKKLYNTLANSVFAQSGKDRNGSYQVKTPTVEEMMSLLVICDKYGLNPFTREIFAFANRGKIVPVVSIDGWLAILNRQPDYDGLEVEFASDTVEISGVKMPEFCRVSIYRKSLSRPIVIAEYAAEAFMPTEVWRKYPRRMLRHKTIVQAARVAFSISGIYDREEGESIAAGEDDVIDVPSVRTPRRQTPSVQTPGYPTIREKDRLDALLDKLLQKFPLTAEGFAGAEAWIRARLESGETQAYALSKWASALSTPKDEVETEFDAPKVPVQEMKAPELSVEDDFDMDSDMASGLTDEDEILARM